MIDHAGPHIKPQDTILTMENASSAGVGIGLDIWELLAEIYISKILRSCIFVDLTDKIILS